MANGKFLPLGERKYLSMKDMAGVGNLQDSLQLVNQTK